MSDYQQIIITTYLDDSEKDNVIRREVSSVGSPGQEIRTSTREFPPVSVTEFIEQLQNKTVANLFVPVIPDGQIRAVQLGEKKNVYVVECVPKVRALLYRDVGCLGHFEPELSEDSPLHYERVIKVSMPWVYLFIEFYEGHINLHAFYSNKQITDPNDELYKPNLTNISDSDCEICMSFDYDSSADIAEQIRSVVERFWTGEWNTDLDDNWELYRDTVEGHPVNHIEWEQKSVENPQFALTINWVPMRWTFKSFMEKLSHE